MAQTVLYLWIFLSFLRNLVTAFPRNTTSPPARTFINELPASRKFSSIRQIRNPKWTSRQVSTTEVYAAPFLKHHIPMPNNLSIALQSPPTPRDLDHMSTLERRVSGQTVAGSNGE